MNFRAILAIANKDIRLLLRDKTGVFFTFMFPIGFALFFGFIFSQSGPSESKLRVVVVDADQSSKSAAFVTRLTGASELVVVTPQTVDAEAKPTNNDLEAWAKSRVLHRREVAYVLVPKGFGEASGKLFAGGRPEIRVGTDPSRKAEMGMLQGVLQKYTFMSMGDAISKPTELQMQVDQARKALRADSKIASTDRLVFETLFGALDGVANRAKASGESTNLFGGGPDTTSLAKDTQANASDAGGFMPMQLTFEEVRPKRTGPTNAFSVSVPQGIIWGVMGAAMGFAASFVTERNTGTLARLKASPLSGMSIMLGKALACFGTTLFACMLMIVIGVIMGVSLSNWPTLLLAITCVCVGFTGIMVFVAGVAKTERAASGTGWAIMMVLAFVGGAAVPTFVMPGWMQAISQISPIAWSLAALEGGLWRDHSMLQIAKPAGMIAGLGIIAMLVGVWMNKRTSR